MFLYHQCAWLLCYIAFGEQTNKQTTLARANTRKTTPNVTFLHTATPPHLISVPLSADHARTFTYIHTCTHEHVHVHVHVHSTHAALHTCVQMLIGGGKCLLKRRI